MSKRVEAATRAAKLKVEMKYLDQETNLFIYLFIYLTALLGTSTWIDIRQKGQCERDMESHAGHYP